MPDSRSRDQIGKDMDENSHLLHYFRNVHGHQDSTEFQQIRAASCLLILFAADLGGCASIQRNFIESMAGYSVFTTLCK